MSPEGDGDYPFSRAGVERNANHVARYTGRPHSLVAALRATVARAPETEAVVEVRGRRVGYAELWQRAETTAAGLHQLGVRPGDRVAVALPNGVDWCIAFFGVLLAGAIVVPINTRLAPPEIDHICTDADIAHLIGPGPLPQGLKRSAVPEPQPEDPAAIFYTSGTTGRPKGAVTTHANFLTNTENARRVLQIDAPWTSLVSVPLFHVTGCNSQFLPSVECGGTLVIQDRFDAPEFLRTVVQERITALMSVPSVYRMAIGQPDVDQYDLSSVVSLTYGGAPMPTGLAGDLRKAFPRARLGNGYGLTEAASFCTYLPDRYVESHSDTVGLAVPTVDLRLRETDPAGVGELMVRGANVVSGYWRNPEATRNAFEDGWLRTGDVAHIDEQGFVQIVDRVKDVIIRGGENVYSAEVERALLAHPSVREVAVVGIPDSVAGEKVAAAIVFEPHADVDLRKVLREARRQLARYKLPELVSVRTSPLPRNAGGKVMKSTLRQSRSWHVAPR